MPKRALTAASVERLKPPPQGQIDVFDQGYPGLALRISYGGGKTWVFFYRIGGRLRRMGLGTYPAVSLSGAREPEGELARRLLKDATPHKAVSAKGPPRTSPQSLRSGYAATNRELLPRQRRADFEQGRHPGLGAPIHPGHRPS